jgi:DHA2 family multidrug resistance protein
LTRELGGSLGTALMGMLVSDDMKRFGSYLGENINVYNPLVQENLSQTAMTVGSQTFQRDLVAESLLKLKVTNQAMVLSFENGFRWTALAMALGVVLVFLLKRPQGGSATVDAH